MDSQTPGHRQSLNLLADDTPMEPETYAPVITPPSVNNEPIARGFEKKVDDEDEESSGFSWQMLLEFYGLLDLVVFIAAIVAAVVKRKQKTQSKRAAEDNKIVSDIYIFIAIIWFPNLVCLLLSLIHKYAIKWLQIFQRWACIRLVLLAFILPVVVMLLDAKSLEISVCANFFKKDEQFIIDIKNRKNFTLLSDLKVDGDYDSLHLISLAPEPEQHLRGFSPMTSEIFADIESELAAEKNHDWVQINGEWYQDGKKWKRNHGSKGLIWSKDRIMQYKVEMCASTVALVSLFGFVFAIFFIGGQVHIINMLIGEAKLAEEFEASRKRRDDRLNEKEQKKLTNLRQLRIELDNALQALRGEECFSSEDDNDGHTGIN